ncbi:valyl-tRNA synthetase [Perkinsela sp. CCAP 1560/4]|nr:valyl-tRNA synthetase [Perkinsela sp. CCAP 1560/4]|eukprot:KNH09693.1 valyl-tRNA synthetase [Perkinsela sp. CCAP 1560/4]
MLAKTVLPLILSFIAMYVYCDVDTIILTLGFAAVHTAVSHLCARNFSHKTLLGYPTWAYYASIFQQLIVLPPIAALIIWRESGNINGWLFSIQEIDGKYPAYKDLLKTLSLMTTASAMIKDYWMYGNDNQWGFIIHHITTAFACAFCLAIPIYSGAVIFVGMFAEFTSLFYNLRVLKPSPVRNFMHVAFMGISNVLAIWLCRLMWVEIIDAVYFHWKVGFTLIVAILSVFRFSGFIVGLPE